MKLKMKVIALLMIGTLSFNQTLANCNWGTDIVKNNGTYSYSRDCHLEVGRLVKSEPLQQKAISDLKKSIELKDLAIDKSEQRTILWMETSNDLNNNMQKINSLESSNKVFYFACGVGLTILSVWAAGQLKK